MPQYYLSEEEWLQLRQQVADFGSQDLECKVSQCTCRYILSVKFIDEWKEYSGFGNSWSDYQSQRTRLQPKPIYNQDLILDQAVCVTSPNTDSPYFYQMVGQLQQSRYKVVGKSVMDIFSNYNGSIIARIPRLVQGQIVVEVSFPQVKFVLMHSGLTDNLRQGQSLPIAKGQISLYATPEELKQEIVEYWAQEYWNKSQVSTSMPPFAKEDINLWSLKQQILGCEDQFISKNIIGRSLEAGEPQARRVLTREDIQSCLIGSDNVLVIGIAYPGTISVQTCVFCKNIHSENVLCYQEKEIGRLIASRSGSVSLAAEDHSMSQVGLKNTGNTCYLNSVVQALVHTRELRSYFLTQTFRKQLNKQNPEGTGGQLAVAFEKIVGQMTKSGPSKQFIDPLDLKLIISQKSPIFKGHSQQDAQQFLMTILDLMHEDLNRTTSRLEEDSNFDKDQTGGHSWSVYCRNNNSIITGLFAGQYQSELTCMNCNHSRSIFEPFLNFTLQVPQKESNIKILFCGYGREKLYYEVNLSLEHVSLSSLTTKMAQLLDKEYNPKRLRMLNWRNGFTPVQNLSHQKLLESLLRMEIICYELSEQEVALMNYSENQTVQIVISFRRTGQSNETPPNRPFWFGKNSSTKDVYRRIWLWIYESSIQHKVDQTLRNHSQTTIFASFFLKIPPLRLSVIIRPEGKDAFYYQQQFSMAFKIFQAVEARYPNTKYQFQCNIDRLSQFCDTAVFGKVGALQLQSKPMDIISLQECIARFSAVEQLNVENPMVCQKCESCSPLSKTISLNKISKYLTIHLKRFKQRLAFRYKNCRFIRYPLTLDTRQCVTTKQENSLYELYAVVSHSGSLNSGHYTTYARDKDVWYLYNDHIVSKVGLEDVITEDAYILFYERKQ